MIFPAGAGYPARFRVFALAGAVALLAALPYLAGGVSDSFVALDDATYISDNPQVRRGLTFQTAGWALTSTEQANWYPLRRLSHLVDASLFGMDARRHHLVSVGWHAAAALLLFLALRLMTGALWRSFVVAGAFGVHPLQVESVAWAAERSNVLAGFCFALTLLLWARYVRRPGTGRYAAALGAGLLGFMAKPVLMTVPFVLLLLDFWPLGRLRLPGFPAAAAPPAPPLGRLLLEKSPLLLMAGASGAMAVIAHRASEALESFGFLPLGARLANAAFSCWSYLGQALWPAELTVHYPHPGSAFSAGRAVLAGLALMGLIAGAFALARRRPSLAVGWLWFAGMLVPTSGIVQFGSHARADRFVYLPLIGALLALVWLAAEAFPPRGRRLAALGAPAAAVLAALAATGAAQVGYWKDSETLFARALAVTRDNWMMHSDLAGVLAAGGRHEEAIFHAREAVRINPVFDRAHFNLGVSLAALGRHAEAVDHFREALRLAPDFAEARLNLGGSLAALGRRDDARALYREGFRAGEWRSHLNLGLALYHDGMLEEAIVHYREGLRLNPGSTHLHNNLGVALEARGRLGEALASYREAVRLDPGYADARINLGTAYLQRGREREGEAELREAIRIAPRHPDAHNNLGLLLERQGKRQEAVAEFRAALQLNPSVPAARANLDRTLAGRTR